MDKKRIGSLDGIRALAMLMVVYFHFWQQNWLTPPRLPLGLFAVDLYPVAAGGFVGVELLFILSGFLLYLPLARGEKLSVGSFYWKRFARIFPCYAICVVICGIFARGEFASIWDLLTYGLKNLLFLNTFSPELLFNKFNSVLWSTAVEMWFYLLFPLIALCMRKRPCITVAVALIGSALYRMWVLRYSGDLPMTMNQLPGMLDCFVGGMFAAFAVGQLQDKSGHKLFGMLGACGGILYLFFLNQMYMGRGYSEGIQYYQVYYRSCFVFSGSLLIGASALAPPLYQRIMGNRLFAFLGAISFNLYLWHQWLAVKLRIWHFPPYEGDPHLDSTWQWQHMLLSFVLSLAVAVVFTYGVERSVGRLLTGWRKRKDKRLDSMTT